MIIELRVEKPLVNLRLLARRNFGIGVLVNVLVGFALFGTVYLLPQYLGQVQRYIVDSREMLYLVTFCLPRFLDQEFDDKFVTLFHELYHISPDFDGDLRRHPGRFDVHSRSKKTYDKHMADLARAYLAGGADPALHAFLRLDFAQLQHRHSQVAAVVVPRPKLLPIVAAETLRMAASE